MREIKFRCWDKRSNEFRYDLLVGNDDVYDVDIGSVCPIVEPVSDRPASERVVVQQYTGLKDMNGVEIYEGDIIGYPEDRNDKTMMEIRWAKAYSGEQWCEFEIQDCNGKGVKAAGPSDFYGGVHPDYMIVVGNIFEGVDK